MKCGLIGMEASRRRFDTETFDGFNQDGTNIRRLEVENFSSRINCYLRNWNVLVLFDEDESLPYVEAKNC